MGPLMFSPPSSTTQTGARGCAVEVMSVGVGHYTGNAVDPQGGCELNVVGKRCSCGWGSTWAAEDCKDWTN